MAISGAGKNHKRSKMGGSSTRLRKKCLPSFAGLFRATLGTLGPFWNIIGRCTGWCCAAIRRALEAVKCRILPKRFPVLTGAVLLRTPSVEEVAVTDLQLRVTF